MVQTHWYNFISIIFNSELFIDNIIKHYNITIQLLYRFMYWLLLHSERRQNTVGVKSFLQGQLSKGLKKMFFTPKIYKGLIKKSIMKSNPYQEILRFKSTIFCALLHFLL